MKEELKIAGKISPDFRPSIFHPYYFIRRGLLKAISKNSIYLKGSVMDFGCGSKPYRKLIHASEYIGVDFMNEGHPHENEQIDIYYNGRTIPLPDERFDGVISSEVFEHIFNLPEVLKEIHRVMKKDGVLLATCPFVWKEHEIPNDYARYTVFALEDILTKSGFEKIVIEKTGNFAEVLFQLNIVFFYDKFYKKLNRIFLVKHIFLLLFVAIPNLLGRLFSKLAGNSKQMYLNNVIVFKKC
ncbi:MAG: class I SAM-dependent methyltransferase [Bacteroidetes bacterium]|nr:class I SAM-dependent methyltransferase [Bacteroidota bacterium]